MHKRRNIRSIRFFTCSVLSIFLLLFSLSTTAEISFSQANSFDTRNLSPFSRLFLSPPLNTTNKEKVGTSQVDLSFQMANYFSISKAGSEKIILDGETWLMQLGVTRQLTKQWQWHLSIPYYYSDKGFLDNFIYQWHSAFSLPQGGRTGRTKGHFQVAYERDNNLLFSQDNATRSIGDLINELSYSFNANTFDWTLNGTLKLPTGSKKALTGSGNVDVGLGLVLSKNTLFSNQKIRYWAGSGISRLGSGIAAMRDIQRDWLWAGRVGAAWTLAPSLSLKAQLDSSTAYYDSGTTELGKPPLQLTLGGDIHLNSATYIELYLVEDLLIQRSPDITISSKLISRF